MDSIHEYDKPKTKSSIFSTVNLISPVKRERMKKKTTTDAMMKLRNSLPVLSKEDIRRYRLQYHEAILLDLQEEGRPSSSAYLKQLIDYQEEMRRQHGPDTKVWSRPRLVEEKAEIDRIASVLKKAETAHYEERFWDECDELTQIAVHYGFGSEDWWWLGEQFMIQTISVCTAYRGDGGMREAQARFIYGKFALENLGDFELAKASLVQARSISMGHFWMAKVKLDKPQITIFTESCILLYKALMEHAKHLLQTEPKRSQAYCTIARRRALDACDHLGEANILMLMGMSQMRYRDVTGATISFESALRTYNRFNQIKDQCDAIIQLALAHLTAGRWTDAMGHLEKLHETARSNGLPFYEGQAYRFLGEYYLNQGNASMATPILIKALHLFHTLNSLMERDQVRNLAAISAGQELMPEYTKLILRSDSATAYGREGLQRLMLWKNSREFFWDSMDAVSVSGGSGEGTSLFSYDLPDKEPSIAQIIASRSEHKVEKMEDFADMEHMALVEEAKALLSYKSKGGTKTKAVFKKP